MTTRSLYQQLLSRVLPRLTVVMLVVSAVLVILVYAYAQQQANEDQTKTLETVNNSLTQSIAGTQRQMQNLAQNHLLINSFIDFENRQSYLPLFIRSLRLTDDESQSVGLFDFTGNPISTNDWQENVPAALKQIWKKSVLTRGMPFFDISAQGVIIAVPILINGGAEGALVLYVEDLQSLISPPVTEELLVISTQAGTILFSNRPHLFPSGTPLNTNDVSFAIQKHENWNNLKLSSFSPLLHAYRNVYSLLALLVLFISSLIFVSMYTARRTARDASLTLQHLYQDIETATATGSAPQSQPLEGEASELADIRKAFNALTANLISMSLSNEQFTNVLDSMNEMLLVSDRANATLLTNRSMRAFCGQYNVCQEEFGIALSEQVSTEAAVELRYVNRRDSTETQISWSAVPLIDRNGFTTGTIFVGNDVSAQRSMEKHINLLSHAIDEATVGIVIANILDPAQPIIYANQAFETITGYAPHDILGKNCRFLQGDDTAKEDLDNIRVAIRNREPIDITLLNYRKDGEPFYNHLILTPVTTENTVTHYIGFQQDVTEQEQTTLYLEKAKQRAEESVKMKADFLASMSHEIRTPIHGISGVLQLLNKTGLDTIQKDYLKLAKNSTDSLLYIVNDILDFSKIEAGQLQIEQAPFNLEAELNSLCAEYEIICENKGLSFTPTISLGESSVVVGDAVRLRQVMVNLLSNAVKFTPSGSIGLNVALEALKNTHQLKVQVTDTGIGIKEDKLDAIFEQFTQENMSTTREYGGTGLGLSISKQLCELMGGGISVKSSKNAGCTFTFTIPLTVDAQSSELVEAHSPADISEYVPIEDIRVLVVEDNEINRLITTQHLSEYKTLCTRSGAEALRALQQTKVQFDLILMDCQMPVMDGFEATRRIRAGEAGEHYTGIPIIALTANAMKGDREICFEAGMNDYLSKPFDARELHAKVRKWASANTSAMVSEASTENGESTSPL